MMKMKWVVVFIAVLCGAQATWSIQCAQRREISPCTCRMKDDLPNQIEVRCERMPDFAQVSEALTGKFPIGTQVSLIVSYSNITDIDDFSLKKLGLHIFNLQLTYDNISDIDGAAFIGMSSVNYLSLADNSIPEVPVRLLRQLPNVKTLDFGRGRVKAIKLNDFQDVPYVHVLVMPGNEISRIDKGAIPHTVKQLHLAMNRLETLNGSIRHLENLNWLFINKNKLTTLYNELPTTANNLQIFDAGFNELGSIPEEFRNYHRLDFLCLNNNNITSLNYALQKSRRLNSLNLSYNRIGYLAQDEFSEADRLERIDLSFNEIRSLNNSMNTLRSLRFLNLTRNKLEEFSLQEIKGLRALWVIDLSHNLITHLSGDTENLINLETRVLELRLNNNLLTRIGGSLMGLHGLLKLNVAYNQLDNISPDDLIGLDELKGLDISHNQITTLFELSKTYLPSLVELQASYNNVTILDKDFHGLPVLCLADLSHNQIIAINYDLVSKTKCKIHGVPSVLKIHLHDNPVLCNDNFNDVSTLIENQQTRIIGDCQVKPIHGIQPQLNDVLSRKILGLGRTAFQRGHFMSPMLTPPHITIASTTSSPLVLAAAINPIISTPTIHDFSAKEPDLLEPIPEAVQHIQD